MINFLNDLANELDFLFFIGPVEYVKDKLFDLGSAIEDALGLVEEAVDGEDDFSQTVEEDLDEEADEFINGHMSEIREIIIKIIKGIHPTEYSDQKLYLKDVFNQAFEACWAYIQDIFNDPDISPELSAKITETMIKDTAVVVAMTMFIEWALKQKPDGNDDNEIYKEEVEI